MKLTAEKGGKFKLYVDGELASEALFEREILEDIVEVMIEDPEASIYYDHSYRVHVSGDLIAGYEPVPTDPDPVPAPPPRWHPDAFTLYDATRLLGESPHLRKIGVAYAKNLWDGADFSEEYPQPDNVFRQAGNLRLANPDLGVLDIRHWPTSLSKAPAGQIEETIERLCTIIDMFRIVNPTMRLGLYSIVPSEIYSHDLEQYRNIFDANNSILQPLADKVDFLAPDCCTRWREEHVDKWEAFAIAHTGKARELAPAKPCLPFVRPRFGPGIYGDGPEHPGDWLSADYWKVHLETLSTHADGAIVTLSHDTPRQQAHEAPWAAATAAFFEGPDPAPDPEPAPPEVTPDPAPDPDPFYIYNASVIDELPILSRVAPLYASQLYGKPWSAMSAAEKADPPTPQQLQACFDRYEELIGDIACLDIEHFKTSADDPAEAEAAIELLIQIWRRAKDLRPNTRFGFYDMVPGYLSSHAPSEDLLAKWQAKNDRMQPLADAVDFLAPNRYSHWLNPAAWRANLRFQNAEARRLAAGKPVYNWLWPQWPGKVYGRTETEGVKGDWIPADVWEFMLEETHKSADGIFIYLLARERADVEAVRAAPWYDITRDFMAAHPDIMAPIGV